MPLKYALSGIEKKLEHAIKNYKEKVAKGNALSIKKATKYVEKLQNDKGKIEKEYTEHEPQWRNITAREAVGVRVGLSVRGRADPKDIFWWENLKTGEIKNHNKPWSPEL